MKAAAVSMVKNECDIIELFVKINSRAFDHLYIVDHDSSDGTAPILARLKDAGHPITVLRHDGIHQSQAQTLTRVVRGVAGTGKYDYIMPLDADEFLTPEASWLESLDEGLRRERYGLVPWKTFVPVSGDYFGAQAPLHANFRMRSSEPVQYHKIVIPNVLAKSCVIGPGSHAMSGETGGVAEAEVPLELMHVPIRSGAQAMQKALIGSHTLSIKPNRLPKEGFHWDTLAGEIRSKGYVLGDADLLRFALDYAAEGHAGMATVSDDNRRVGLPADVIEHKALAQQHPIAAFDAFLAKTCAEINTLSRSIATQPERKSLLSSLMSGFVSRNA